MSRGGKYQAIVLDQDNLGESDLIVSLFTREVGKWRCVAKGAKRSKKRFMNALEPFTQLRAIITQGKPGRMPLLEGVTVVNPYESIRASYKCFLFGSLALELVDLWCRQAQPEEGIFSLLLQYLRWLEGGEQYLWATLVFKARLLKESGVMPRFDRCSSCGRPPKGTRLIFSLSQGQILCQDCVRQAAKAKGSIGLGTVRTLEFWLTQPLDKLPRLKINQSVAQEAWQFLKVLHSYNLDREPKSYNLIKEL